MSCPLRFAVLILAIREMIIAIIVWRVLITLRMDYVEKFLSYSILMCLSAVCVEQKEDISACLKQENNLIMGFHQILLILKVSLSCVVFSTSNNNTGFIAWLYVFHYDVIFIERFRRISLQALYYWRSFWEFDSSLKFVSPIYDKMGF